MAQLTTAVKEALLYRPDTHPNSARKAIDDVCSASETMLEDVCQEIRGRHDMSEGKFVIHYTSIGVLVSMLDRLIGDSDETHVSLRAYDSVHLNDPYEGNFLTRFILDKHDWLGENEMRHAYVASFIIQDESKKMEDNLVFWRGYGKGGEGCSLVIPVGREREEGYLPLSSLREVLYGEQKTKPSAEKILPILDELRPLIDADDLPTRKHARERLAEVVWRALDQIRYLYKDEAYKYENECRFVLTMKEDNVRFEYHDRGDFPPRLRHYIEHEDLGIRKLLTSGSSILIGPAVPHADNVLFCLNELKQKAGVLGPDIMKSEIPYRKS